MYLRFLSVLRAGLVLWRPERAGADKTCSTSNWTETLSRAFPRWTCHRERQLCLFLLLFCLKPARHVWKHTVFLVVSHSCTPSDFSLEPSRGLRLTGFNHAWLSHTLNHAVASLIVCYYPSCISIQGGSPSLSSSPLHRRSFSPRVGCGAASVCRDSVRERKKKVGCWGLSSVFVVTAVQINIEEDALRVCQLLS